MDLYVNVWFEVSSVSHVMFTFSVRGHYGCWNISRNGDLLEISLENGHKITSFSTPVPKYVGSSLKCLVLTIVVAILCDIRLNK